jgi:hypothetical protein
MNRKFVLSPVLFAVCMVAFAQDVQSKPGFIQTETSAGFTLKFGSLAFGPYQEMTNPPYVSLDGKNYVFTLRKNDTDNWILANGKEYGPFKGDWIGDVRISDDGSSWIVTIVIKTDSGEAFTAVANGKEYSAAGGVQHAEFFPGGFFFFASNAESSGKKETWVFTPTAKFGPYDEVKEIIPLEDKKGVMFGYVRNWAQYLHIGDKDVGAYEALDPVYAGGKDGRAVGYISGSKAQSTLFIGSRQITYERIESWYVSPDGSVLAVKGRKGDKCVLNINGKETVYDWVNWREYDNGYFYVAQREGGGQATIVLNGKEVGSYAEARETFLTPGGNWGAVVAKKKGANMYTLVVINGKEYDGEALRVAKASDGYQFIWLKYADNDQVLLQSLKAAK